ncbi:MAG: hypothetical protein LBK63_05540 [Treponema sp.]|nr:hypothetical protein [Treponema sp.]
MAERAEKDGLPFDRLIEKMGLAAKWRAEGKAESEARGWKKRLEKGH